MIRTGTVVEVADGRARICLEPPGEGPECRTCRGRCGSAGRVIVEAPAPETVGQGDVVRIEMELPSPAWSAFILFLAPLVLLMSGLGLWQWLGPQPASQGTGLLVGGGLMVVWYVGVAVYDRALRRSPKHEARIVE